MVYEDAHGRRTAVIDLHAHSVPAGLAQAADRGEDWYGVEVARTDDGRVWWHEDGRRTVLTWKDPGGPLEDRLRHMDADRVDVHVLSQSPLMLWYHLDAKPALAMAQEINDTLADNARRWPDRFQGFAYLPLQDPAASVTELQRAVRELGLAGALLGTNVNGRTWDDPELRPVLEAAHELDAPVFFHPNASRWPLAEHGYHLTNVIGNPVETSLTCAALIFGGVLDRLPGLKIVLAHGGGYVCMGLGRHDHAARVRRECRDIAALPSEYARTFHYDFLTHSPTSLRFLVDEVGTSQVVLGTDHPADMEQSEPVTWLERAPQFSDEERLAILGGNARRLLGEHAGRFTVD